MLFLEEEILSGGFGMHLADEMHRAGIEKRYDMLATRDAFVTPTLGKTPLEAAGLSAKDIKKAVMALKEKLTC